MAAIPEVIFLCGFSGSGKTETGKILAEKLGYQFVDTDKVIEDHFGKSIPEIFAQQGEAKFRFAESDVIRMAVRRKSQVIALGGGAVSDEHNLAYMRQFGVLIYLKVTPETVLQRLKQSHFRPLLGEIEEDSGARDEIMNRIETLMQAREKCYLKADLVLDTENMTPEEVAEDIRGVLDDVEQ